MAYHLPIRESADLVRLKITRQLSGSMDGVELSHFRVGEVYDVGTSIGSYLLALGAAEPVPDRESSVVPPMGPTAGPLPRKP